MVLDTCLLLYFINHIFYYKKRKFQLYKIHSPGKGEYFSGCTVACNIFVHESFVSYIKSFLMFFLCYCCSCNIYQFLLFCCNIFSSFFFRSNTSFVHSSSFLGAYNPSASRSYSSPHNI